MSKIDFLLSGMELKDTPRKGWILRGVEEPEDVASHSWGVAYLCTVFAPETELDSHKVLKMAVVHDVPEAHAGDKAMGEVYQEVTNAQKIEEEEAAWDIYQEMTDVSELRALWEDLENRQSPEAKFVADMDLLDMCITALIYERQDRYDPSNGQSEFDDLDGFFETADNDIQTQIGRELYEEVYDRYQAAKAGAPNS